MRHLRVFVPYQRYLRLHEARPVVLIDNRLEKEDLTVETEKNAVGGIDRGKNAVVVVVERRGRWTQCWLCSKSAICLFQGFPKFFAPAPAALE